jgi:hypothetical protein
VPVRLYLAAQTPQVSLQRIDDFARAAAHAGPAHGVSDEREDDAEGGGAELV